MLSLARLRVLFSIIVTSLFLSSQSQADSSVADSPLSVSERSWGSLVKEKVRIQNYSEWMTPALNGSSVPDPSGADLAPTFMDGRVWLDYAITPKYRLLYWQRYFIFPFNDYSLYDPRIGLRWMQVFDVPGLSTTYDFYFLPGITKMAHDANRWLEVGIRTNTSYSLPNSRWDLGGVTEVNSTFYNAAVQAKNLWGVLAPWTSYRLSKNFSTQHWFMFPFKYQSGNFSWDATGMPFVQNGIGWSTSESVWIGAFLNNYLAAAPSFQNTWVSMWLNLTVI